MSPGLEHNHKFKYCSCNFPTRPHISGLLEKCRTNISMHCCSPIQRKMSKKVGNRENYGQTCPLLSTRIRTLSPGLENNHRLKCWSCIFPTTLTYVVMLENCQNNISIYGCFPIQGKNVNSCWNFIKPGSQSATYALFSIKY